LGTVISEAARAASAFATVTLVALLLLEYVLGPRLTVQQRRGFSVATFPLVVILTVYMLLDLLEALP